MGTPLSQRGPVRLVRALSVLTIGLLLIALNVPRKYLPEPLAEPIGTLGGKARMLSFVQSWKMYAPNPQRAQTYMNLTAHYEDGSQKQLWETAHERAGWHTHFAWNKTREDIWRHYANFRPKQNSEHRRWYLRGVCVREARTGRTPTKIVMEHVNRRFTKPDKVAAGAKPLSPRRKKLITVAYCKVRPVQAMIDADQARRAG